MTQRISEKKVGKAMSGALFMFSRAYGGETKEWSLGSFAGSLIRYGNGVGKAHKSMYYFATGSKGGGGSMTPAMAREAVSFIRNGVQEGDKGSGYKGPSMSPLSDKYATWKDKAVNAKFRGRPIMTLTGSTAKAIKAIKGIGSKGLMSITIDPKATALDPLTGGATSTKVTDYIFSHEYGTRGSKSHRPIVTGVMAGWIATRSPAWSRFYKELMWDVVWDPDKRKTSGGKTQSMTLLDGTVVDVGAGAQKISLDAAMAAQSMAASLEVTAKGITRQAQSLLNSTSRGAAQPGYKPTSEQNAAVTAMLKKHLSGGGLSSQQISSVIATALSGKYVDFED